MARWNSSKHPRDSHGRFKGSLTRARLKRHQFAIKTIKKQADRNRKLRIQTRADDWIQERAIRGHTVRISALEGKLVARGIRTR